MSAVEDFRLAPAPRARPWVRRSRQCVGCGLKSPYLVSYAIWRAKEDGGGDFGPFCLTCEDDFWRQREQGVFSAPPKRQKVPKGLAEAIEIMQGSLF